jgi:hypothetical protein
LKLRAAFVLILGIVIVGGGLWISRQQPAATKARIELRSNPYPLAVGWGTLSVAIVDDNQNRIDNAKVRVSSQMMHPGMLPFNQQAALKPNDSYEVSINWPMMGMWTVDVTAELPQGIIEDQFEVYVYPVPVRAGGLLTTFRSASEINALVSDPARELAIVIPQGTQALIRLGQAEDLIPTEIRLNVSGQNTLVIQNNDIVDHTIGPFLVRSGEVVRQKFTSPSVYQGVCSLNVAEAISIIVEG